MSIRGISKSRSFRPAVGAVLAVVCGLLFLFLPLGDPWIHASYDYLLRFGSRSVTNRVVLVLMDNEAHARLGQSREMKWDRALHARLLNKIADDHCPLVVMDVTFNSPGNPGVDAAMTSALGRLSNVVLNASLSAPKAPGVEAVGVITPLPDFLTAAKNHWGLPRFDHDSDYIVRRHWPFPSPVPSFPSTPWVAAKLSGAKLADEPEERWLRYYDYQHAWTSLSYHFALAKEPGYFRDKIVFIASEPRTTKPDEENDKFRTPHFNWTGETVGGVTLLATEYLNLLNGDALHRWSLPVETLLLIISGAISGIGLARFGRKLAVVFAFAIAFVIMLGAVLMGYYTNFWFPWLIVVGGQIPCALGWALLPLKSPVATIPLPAAKYNSPSAEAPAASHDVFISYASQDQAVAEAVCVGLEAKKIRCWIAPRDVEPGVEYREAIVSAIESCRIMVLIFSAQVNDSRFIRNEVDCAMDHGGTVIPFLIEDVEPAKGLKFSLGNKHWLKAFPPPLKPFIAQLADVVSRQLQIRNPSKPAPANAPVPMPADKTIVLSFPEADSPDAPDYELFNPPVGQGAYGKVWVVRNAIGQWQALKAIYQSKFGDNVRPYEAEFNGLQKYKPVSEKHPGLLRIELISKMKPEGYFYYVMELGDAQVAGWEKNPPSYKPRDLDNMRRQSPGCRLPVAECLRVLTILADALGFLHQQGLIHRDIKPSNVIFVNNRPKLADIGLVADIRPPDYENTLIGTPGYMPPLPERPGTIQADIYALGMVLYVISSGNHPAFFPEISATLMERSGHEEFIRLDAVILKACQPDLAQRYKNTALMLQDLQAASKND